MSIKSLNKKIKINFLNNFLYILIILCSLKFFGYVVGFIFLIPIIFFKKEVIIRYISSQDNEIKLVIYYFFYLIIQSFIGAYALLDYRIIIYWVTFFLVSLYSYLFNYYKFSEDINYKLNLQKILYKSSLIYFIVFFVFNVISFYVYRNEYDIQRNFWVGGSTSFNISSIFLYIIFYKWSKISFKLKSLFTLSITSYTFLILLNNSRLGQLYLLLFLIFTLLKSFKINKLKNGILVIAICLFTYSLSYSTINNLRSSLNKEIDYVIQSPLKETKTNIVNILNIPKDIKNENLSSYDTNRIIELKVGLEKFYKSQINEKVFGTGWYSSRVTINDTRDEIIDQLGIEKSFSKSKVTQLQGIVSLLLDNGLFGFVFTMLIFGLNIKNVITYKSEFLNKSFYLSILFVNFFCLFIGYPWINIPFILMLLPKGLFFLEEYK